MNKTMIYLSGGMSGLSYEEQLQWRDEFKKQLSFVTDTSKISFFSPPTYYSPATHNHKSEREAFEYDIERLRKSNIVVVNFNVPNSIGTAMELAIARELRIPIIGLNCDNKPLHPWLTECCTRICDNMDELVEHIAWYYCFSEV